MVTEDATDVEDKLNCDKCDKTFKLNIMLKRHLEICGKVTTPVKMPQKELLIALDPIDGMKNRNIVCEMCSAKFKTVDNLAKHMKVVHAAVLKREDKRENGKVSVPCMFCKKKFDDYYVHNAHFNKCPKRDDSLPLECPVCKKVVSRKSNYFIHLKNLHLEPRISLKSSVEPEMQEYHECKMCFKKLATQQLLITHLAAHVSNIEDNDGGADNESRYCSLVLSFLRINPS